MSASDFAAFARRDWERLADLKAEYWARLRSEEGPGKLIEIADHVRAQAVETLPSCLDEGERRRDLETHVRVSELLLRAGLAWRL